MPMGRLSGKVAIVTGAAGGIGFASAELFAREGASVLLVDREEEPLRKAQKALESFSVAAVTADVSSLDDTRRYVDEAMRRFGGTDVLFANAGIEGASRRSLNIPRIRTTPCDSGSRDERCTTSFRGTDAIGTTLATSRGMTRDALSGRSRSTLAVWICAGLFLAAVAVRATQGTSCARNPDVYRLRD
jgi:NAD(P)-dependent dehydrogenase (short-subunit alcohol dehydrogenase family)